MLVDVADRGSGKTSRALAWLSASPETRALISPYPRVVRDAAMQMYGVAAREWHIISDARAELRGYGITEVWVDDVEFLLKQALPGVMAPVAGISVSGEVME